MIARWLSYKPNRIVLIGCFLAGILLGLYLPKFGYSIPPNLALLSLSLLIFLRRPKTAAILAMISLGIIMGLLRGQNFYNKVVKYSNYYGKSILVSGVVIDDTSYDERKQTEFHIGSVTLDGKKLPGRIRVRGFGANQVSRGDLVEVRGSLNRTVGTSRQGSMSFAAVKVVGKNRSWVEKVRGRFFAAIYSSLPEPQGSLGLGFLVGVRTALPQDFSDKLALVGLTHIIAVSGYNLTILVQVVRKLFEKRSAYQSVLFSGILIVLFLLMTGWSPSIMRAAIITGFSLVAWYYGRTIAPLLLILIGAATTGIINPLYIWGDVGWYLSFLAFGGILILAPLIINRLYSDKKPNFLIAILIETLAAIIMTAPYIAWLFGRISLIAPIANVIVGPLIPLTMLLVFIVGTVGIFFPLLALWLAALPRAVLTFIVWIVERLSLLPNAQIEVAIKPVQVALMYGALFGLNFTLWVLQRRAFNRGKAQKIDWNLV